MSSEDQGGRIFGNPFNKFYDEIIASIRDADSIRILDPGEAEGELVKRIALEGLNAHILAIETVDKLTDRQISAKVRDRFPA